MIIKFELHQERVDKCHPPFYLSTRSLFHFLCHPAIISTSSDTTDK